MAVKPTLSTPKENAATKAGATPVERSQRSLGSRVRYLYRAFLKVLARELGPFEISTSQWSVLRALSEHEGLSQVELADRMLVEKAALTAVLQSMETAGLIRRARNADDKRMINIYLTAKGRRLKEKALPMVARINDQATRGFSRAEVRQLEAMLERVLRNIQE